VASIDALSGIDTVGQKYANIDRLKTSDSNWTFQHRFRDGSVRQYELTDGEYRVVQSLFRNEYRAYDSVAEFVLQGLFGVSACQHSR